ncbi:hypothetical protein AB5V95_01145 [Metamycoplasma spumans]|uniref:hypothetical protein n=1 Tax=Metamycoplasma spumans TaxID=92406 RepID=UPI00048653CC
MNKILKNFEVLKKFLEYLDLKKQVKQEYKLENLKFIKNKDKLNVLRNFYLDISTKLTDLFEKSLDEDYLLIYRAIFKNGCDFNINFKDFYCSKSTFYRKVKQLISALMWLIC